MRFQKDEYGCSRLSWAEPLQRPCYAHQVVAAMCCALRSARLSLFVNEVSTALVWGIRQSV